MRSSICFSRWVAALKSATRELPYTAEKLRGVDVDMNDISDTRDDARRSACFAEGPTTIRNVAHIRHKETDRIAALATELRKLGAEVEEREDGLTITPKPLKGLRASIPITITVWRR